MRRQEVDITWLVLLLPVTAGCQGFAAPAVWPEPVYASAEVTEQTRELLLQWTKTNAGKADDSPGDWGRVIKVQAQLAGRPSAMEVQALAEVAYAEAEVALKERPSHSSEHLYVAATYAYHGCFEMGEHPFKRRLKEIYNSSLARLIQTAQRRGQLDPKKGLTIATAHGDLHLPILHNAEPWRPDDFDHLTLVGDYETDVISSRYRREGFGVPLVAKRKKRDDGTTTDRYCSPVHPFAVSAFLVPDTSKLRHPELKLSGPPRARLELHDPFRVDKLHLNDKEIPLAGDLSAPLVVCLHQSLRQRLDLLGFRQPELVDGQSGLFFLEPYQPGKIPVIFVHGLLSDPHTWDELLNELRADPAIKDRYQFGLFLYATGNPFLLNASRLRNSLKEMVERLDPDGRDPALRDMVLVGHSMGGLLSRLQITESGDKFWQIATKRPIQDLKTSPETKLLLLDNFFFKPQPYIKRVVFIATPHQGSCLAHNVVGRFGSTLVQRPRLLEASQKQLIADNPGIFSVAFNGVIPSSIDDLATGSFTLKVLAKTECDPNVRLHSIIGRGRLLPLFEAGDGVVAVSSAHLNGVESELAIDASHTEIHGHPSAIREVKRILMKHLRESPSAR